MISSADSAFASHQKISLVFVSGSERPVTEISFDTVIANDQVQVGLSSGCKDLILRPLTLSLQRNTVRCPSDMRLSVNCVRRPLFLYPTEMLNRVFLPNFLTAFILS